MKIKNIIIGSCSIVLFIIISVIIKYKLDFDNELERKGLYLYFYENKNENELIQKVCEKNGNWKNYPLSSKFLAKYNEKDGIFGDMQFDKVEVNKYFVTPTELIDNTTNKQISMISPIIITQGLKKTEYSFRTVVSENVKRNEYELDDIIITDSKVLIDENGIEQDTKTKLDNQNHKTKIIYTMLDEYDNDDNLESVAITPHFKEKYSHFLDLFIHYSPLSFNKIKFIEDESDLDNNIAILEVDSILECKKRKYKVKLILDDKLYLDDCEVEMIEETAYKGNSENRTNKIYYKNSNWDGLKLTKDFLNKFNNNDGSFSDINKIDIDEEMIAKTIGNKKYIEIIKYVDGTYGAYIMELKLNSEEELEDVIYTKIEYNGETLDELKSKYK